MAFYVSCLLLLLMHLVMSEPIHQEQSGLDQEPVDAIYYSDRNTVATPLTLADEIRWTKLWRRYETDHQVYEAPLYEAQDIVRSLGLENGQHNSVDCQAGRGIIEPTGILYEEDSYRKTPMKDEVYSKYLNPIDIANYPGYAIGLLTSKNCTAFLIGPYHALTLAECVYNATTKRWITELDLWLARNCSTYSNRMKWASVTIPRQYFTEGNTSYNWAYIEFDKSNPSKSWIGLSYDNMFSRISPPVTMNGYCNEKPYGCPYSTLCMVVDDPEKNDHRFLVNCGITPIVSFLGGPVIASPYLPNSAVPGSTPRLFGISSKYLEPNLYEAVNIKEEIFWLLYTWMDKSGHTPTCNIRYDRFVINRFITE